MPGRPMPARAAYTGPRACGGAAGGAAGEDGAAARPCRAPGLRSAPAARSVRRLDCGRSKAPPGPVQPPPPGVSTSSPPSQPPAPATLKACPEGRQARSVEGKESGSGHGKRQALRRPGLESLTPTSPLRQRRGRSPGSLSRAAQRGAAGGPAEERRSPPEARGSFVRGVEVLTFSRGVHSVSSTRSIPYSGSMTGDS